MIRQLRKRHLQIWTLLMFLLPAGILAAWLVVKKPVSNNTLDSSKSEALPLRLKAVDKKNYTAAIRTDLQRSLLQLEWINKSEITSPSALIYKVSGKHVSDISENDLIGRIDSKDSLYFALKNDQVNDNRFILYDFIHQKIIDSINLNQ